MKYNYNKKFNKEENILIFKKCNLADTGRKQFFYHYPNSKLPIRVIARIKGIKYGKTEPHIEIATENYLRECLPINIKGFCESNERFLFLCTQCKNKELKKLVGKRFVIGYIKKESCKPIKEENGNYHLAVFGKSYIVPFDEKLSYKRLGFMGKSRQKKLDKSQTKHLLKLIHSHKNIINKCIIEMIKQESIARKQGNNYITHDKECRKDKCVFKDKCLRRKLK